RMSLPERRRRGRRRGMFKPSWRHRRRTRASPRSNQAAMRRYPNRGTFGDAASSRSATAWSLAAWRGA
ncbi:hypothetical protein EIM48_15260, partial [Pseudoxanthomonas sp. SGNA-20]